MEKTDKIKLNIYGLSYDSMSKGSYSLLLKEEDGKGRLLPISIGGFEAQSIAIALEKVPIVRPLTHDLLKSILDRLNVNLNEVIIHKFEDGIFFSILVMDNDMEIDSRTSDAVALSIKYDCPIYTYDDVIEKGGYSPEDVGKGGFASVEDEIAFLEDKMQNAIDEENYEEAAKLRDELKEKKCSIKIKKSDKKE